MEVGASCVTHLCGGYYQGCIQKFCRGGANLGYGQKRGGGAPGGSSIVSCEVLHSRGGENDTRGGANAPAPPLNTTLTTSCVPHLCGGYYIMCSPPVWWILHHVFPTCVVDTTSCVPHLCGGYYIMCSPPVWWILHHVFPTCVVDTTSCVPHLCGGYYIMCSGGVE